MGIENNHHYAGFTPRSSGMGDEMIDTARDGTQRRWLGPTVAIAFVLLIASVAGAAPRVVLGEYFTNIF